MLEFSVPINIIQLLFCLSALFFALNRRSRFFFTVCFSLHALFIFSKTFNCLVLCPSWLELVVWNRIFGFFGTSQLRAVYCPCCSSSSSFSCEERPRILSSLGATSCLSFRKSKWQWHGSHWRGMSTAKKTCKLFTISISGYYKRKDKLEIPRKESSNNFYCLQEKVLGIARFSCHDSFQNERLWYPSFNLTLFLVISYKWLCSTLDFVFGLQKLALLPYYSLWNYCFWWYWNFNTISMQVSTKEQIE